MLLQGRGGRLKESMESDLKGAGGGGWGVNKDGIERVKTEMRGCVGGRDVGVWPLRKKERGIESYLAYPLALQMFMIKTSFLHHLHTPLLTQA